jgi:exodeoxyribonuclease-1
MSDKPQKTFYFHDYETFGKNPALDRPAQFAGVRTDEDFQYH